MKNHLVKFSSLVLLVPFLFLIVSIYTLKDYGVNWDEPYHFMRGQAYLHFLMTGEKDYSSLPRYPRLSPDCPDWANGTCGVSPGGATDILPSVEKGPVHEDAVNKLQPNGFLKTWRSSFQHDNYDFKTIMVNESGHPPVNDILAAFTNYIFYQKLHILGDIESHHLFEILMSFLIILGVGVLTSIQLGIFPAIIASLSLAIYPLFFSESHFNIKDPPLASFFGLSMIFFYLGIVRKNWKLLIVSALFTGLALGTKLNTVFAPLIVVPWLIFFLVRKYIESNKIFINKGVLITLILYAPIALGLVYILWPFLWSDPVGGALKIAGYYKQIGIGTPGEMAKYIFHKWNTYPFFWTLYTTQIPILILSGIGIIYSVYRVLVKKDNFSLFILLWLSIPIIRASWPNVAIYGGIRQLMEFVPALAITAGIGAYVLYEIFKRKKIVLFLIVLSMCFATYEIARIHPNENIYFNQLIGGINGARDKNIPYWGNTYGNVYQQGLDWLNKNAEPNAKLGLPIATQGNLSRNKLRADINYSNSHWSGTKREGEYEIELDFEWAPKYWYSFQYYDKYLNPVFVSEVDGVPLLKVWKNDLEHTKPEFREEINYAPKSIAFRKNMTNQEFFIDMGRSVYLTRVTINHAVKGCNVQKGGYVALSEDNKAWTKEPDPISGPQVPITATGWDEDTFVFLFAGKKARYFVLDPQMEGSCLLTSPKIQIRGLKTLP